MLAGHLAKGNNQEALKLLAEYEPKVFPLEGTDLFVNFVRAKAKTGH